MSSAGVLFVQAGSPTEILGDGLSLVTKLVSGLVSHFVDSARAEIDGVLNKYLYSTVDTVGGGGAYTANETLRRLNGGLVLAVDILTTAVVLFAALRSMFDRSMKSHYALKVTIPRLLLALVLAHGSMLFMQMGIDLNNALGHVATQLGDAAGSATAPWSGPIAPDAVTRLRLSGDLFRGIFDVVLVVALVLLAFAYVIRTALLNVLVVMAPLAAILMVLPETRNHGRSWLRLFLVTVFMQAVQLIVLRVAVATAFDHGGGLMETLYALATLYLMLKVPGALNTASHMETKAHTAAHHVERAVHKALVPHHTTSRSHA